MRHEEFFAYGRERYNILLRRRAGETRPWTKDEYLRQFKFCNVFREDDRTTVWIKENLREPLRDSPKVFQAMVIARWFNRIETLEHIKEMILEDRWTSEEARPILEKVSPLITAAYMIRTPPGMDKLTGLLWNIDQALPTVREKSKEIAEGESLRAMTHWLARFPNLGNFLAYEVITDLRHTALLEDAPDIMTWANPGPGCERGIERIMEHPVRGEEPMVEVMLKLLELSKDPANWPAEWPAWEMRDVEHNLCDWDKYERVRLGEGTPKQRFDGGGAKTISYGLGKSRPSPRAPVDPVAALVDLKLAPARAELDAVRVRLEDRLRGAVDGAYDLSLVPESWLPLVDSALFILEGEEYEVSIIPPRRLPSVIAEHGLVVADEEASKIRGELAVRTEALAKKEAALRAALDDL